jgi:hypothetical protein
MKKAGCGLDDGLLVLESRNLVWFGLVLGIWRAVCWWKGERKGRGEEEEEGFEGGKGDIYTTGQ